MPNYVDALNALKNCLAPNGIMIHSCPNYNFPYEPHFGLPIIKSAPKLTTFFFAKRIEKMTDVWKSLNFISASDIKSYCAQAGLEVEFDQNIVLKTLSRLKSDPLFIERHKKLGSLILSLEKTGLFKLLNKLPASVLSPMTFKIRNPKN
ncbi:MAG: hypothetical protein ACFHVJ_20090 [Aestuariibacter sp.]